MKKEQDICDKEIIDVHTHASGIDVLNFLIPRLPSTQSVAELEEKIRRNGVSYCIVFPMPISLYYNPRLILEEGKFEPSGWEDFPYEKENRALLYEVSLSSGLFFPFLAIDPKEKVEKQAKFLRNIKGYFGLKLHSRATRSSPPDLEESPFLEILRERNIPLMIHSGRQENTLPEHILAFAQKHPDIRVCLAHLACFDAGVISQTIGIRNLFIDTSPFLGCCYLAEKKDSDYLSPNDLNLEYSDPIKTLVFVNRLLRGHLIWGTDEPWTILTHNESGQVLFRSSYEEECALLEKLDGEGFQDVKHEIVNQNIKRYLWG